MRRIARGWKVALLALVSCGDADGGFTLGAEALVEITPGSLSFAYVKRGEVAYRVVTVYHGGTGGTIDLDVHLDTTSPDLYLAEVERSSLEPGQESRIRVEYRADHDEADVGSLVIGHNLAENPRTVVPVSSPGQTPILVGVPGRVDFGIVQAGAPATVKVLVTNIGTVDGTLSNFVVDGDTDTDFGVYIPPEATVAPGASVTVELSYHPTGRDSDAATVTLLTERPDASLSIPVEGEELTPVLVVEPQTIQFGWVEPGQSELTTLVVRNQGNTWLEVDSLALGEAHPSLKLLSVPAFPQILAPDDWFEVGVLFSPIEQVPMSSQPLGKVVVASSDEARNPFSAPIFGAAGVPSLQVVPDDTVDFAFVAQNFTAKRAVTVVNVGTLAVTVTGAEIVGATSDEFEFATPERLPATLLPSESVDLELTFTNRGAASGSEFAQFLLYSNDPVIPEYPLGVVARRSEAPTCEPAFVPDLLAMGAAKEGSIVDGVMQVVNYGSGNCEYEEYDLEGCLNIQSDYRFYYNCQVPGFVAAFEVVDAPPPGSVMGPGDIGEFTIRFHAPPVTDHVVGRDPHYARLAAIFTDPNQSKFVYLAPEGGWFKGINVRAEAAEQVLIVDPPLIDFGSVRGDCSSPASLIKIINKSPLESKLLSVDLSGCAGTMKVDVPGLPATIPGYQILYLEAFYAPPKGSGAQTACAAKIGTDGKIANYGYASSAAVDLGGKVLDLDHHTDSFQQVPPSSVDVLFIVDDSGSMADEQVKLHNELPKLVELAVNWGQDYHLAVTTTDTKLLNGKFKGVPAVATPEHTVAEFADNLIVGTAGFWDEKGLLAAWMALSGTNVVDTGIPCVNAPGQCPQYEEGKYYWCLDGTCKGPNAQFLRKDAQLVIIIISDEEDGSEDSVEWFVTHFAGLKPVGSGVGVKLHGIITPPEGCVGGFGTPGDRYIQAVDAMGGVWTSICAPEFSDAFAQISAGTFGLTDRFYPTYPPDPVSIQVRVDGVACDAWEWNAVTQSLVFPDMSAACAPQYGQTVEIEYDILCFATSGG
jgi:hypothetical protein